MSRYMEAINLLIRLKRAIASTAMLTPEPAQEAWIGCINQVLAMPESEGEQAIREGDEMIEEAYRMNF